MALQSRPHIIILNGVGSVGKSSTAKALQEISAEPFLHVAMDAFLDMLPKAMLDHPEGLVFEASQEEGARQVAIRTGPVLDRAMRGMRHAIAAMAAEGNNLIVDDVLIAEGAADDYRKLLADYRLRFVGLFAPLALLEAREKARGDREIGLARWQYTRVHRDIAYDLKLDTSRLTPAECALAIRDAFGS